MSEWNVTQDILDQFHRDGFIIARNLFSVEETDLLRRIGKADRELADRISERRDATGGITTLALSNELGDNIYSAVVRSERMVSTMERLLGDEVYHYHHKMNMKEPFVGGAWEWHQDYGYWYNNGCLYPDMASCMIAVDPATRENGCLQVLKGSHLMGRIEHGTVGDQTGADLERVGMAAKSQELIYCTMEPGDAVFFHSNLLHRSDRNDSPDPRWVLICCYNTRHNDPYKKGKHPNYTPLSRCSDDEILKAGIRQLERMSSASGEKH